MSSGLGVLAGSWVVWTKIWWSLVLYAASFSITADVQPGDPGVILESMLPFMASCPVSHQVLAVPSPEPHSPVPSLLRCPPIS